MIAWKPFADINTPSSRLRAFLPMRALQRAGGKCELFDPARRTRYQLVVFQKAYSERDIALAGELKRLGVKTLFDLCDNHFYSPDGASSYQERAERLRRMIDAVDAISVSTPALANLIPDRRVSVIDDLIDVSHPLAWIVASIRRGFKRSVPLRIVWFGSAGRESPAFGMIDLKKIVPVLESMSRSIPIKLSVISNSRPLFDRYLSQTAFPTSYFDWHRFTFACRLPQHDLCILPVTLNPFTLCKSNNRLVLSLLSGVPVIADRIPSYEEFGDFVLFDDWQRSLETYATDAKLRRDHVVRGRRYIGAKFTEARVVAAWTSCFEKILSET